MAGSRQAVNKEWVSLSLILRFAGADLPVISAMIGCGHGRQWKGGGPSRLGHATTTRLISHGSRRIAFQELKVCRLFAGADWIRNFSSALPLVVARVSEIRDLGRAAGRIAVRSLDCRRERIRTPVGSRR